MTWHLCSRLTRASSLSVIYADNKTDALESFAGTFGSIYDVRIARTAARVSRMLEERTADVVIVSKTVAGGKAQKLFAEVARKYPRSYRVMLTAGPTVGEMINKDAVGTIDSVVAEPWTAAAMSTVLERATVVVNQRLHGRSDQRP